MSYWLPQLISLNWTLTESATTPHPIPHPIRKILAGANNSSKETFTSPLSLQRNHSYVCSSKNGKRYRWLELLIQRFDCNLRSFQLVYIYWQTVEINNMSFPDISSLLFYLSRLYSVYIVYVHSNLLHHLSHKLNENERLCLCQLQ